MNENSPAFSTQSGLTKRELFAALAMQSLAGTSTMPPDWVANRAIKYADALIAALEGQDDG